MFDREKINFMLNYTENFLQSYSNIYAIFDKVSPELIPLIKRLKSNIKAILNNGSTKVAFQYFMGVPIVNMNEVAQNFDEKTAIFMSTEKPYPNFQMSINVKIGGGV